MGCGCGGKGVTPDTQFVIKFSDGSSSSKYPDEPTAKVALARSGKGGRIVPVLK